MIIQIFSIVFPVFAVIVVGFAYGRRHRPDMLATNQVNMDVFVPALVFSALAGQSFSLEDVQMIAIGGFVVVLGPGLLGLPLARWLGYQPKTLLPPMMFKNAGNMGLPLLLLAFGHEALPAAVILFLIENILHFTISSLWLGNNVKLWRLLREPVFIAGAAGIAVSISGIMLWQPVLAAFKVIGDVATGLMLFALGVRLNTAPLGEWRIGLVGAIATPASGLLLAALFCWGFDLSSRETDILILFGALPPAVLNYMFAERYGQQPEKVAAIVILGNLFALISISMALAIRLAG
ncbi:MAG: AEC family transporter [Zoogloeaceae bacterium]|nr:AEC family transporter [Rhodocyclaceae bacterium]MCP5237707.1 AEC family transporter [Zoogloeaceae bacterium]